MSNKELRLPLYAFKDKIDLPPHLVISIMEAMQGEIDIEMRAIAAKYQDKKLQLCCYMTLPPIEENYQSLEKAKIKIMKNEFCKEPIQEVTYEFIHTDEVIYLLDPLDSFLYVRKEGSLPDWLLAWILQALLGEIYSSIQHISVGFYSQKKRLHLRYYIDRPSSEEDERSIARVIRKICNNEHAEERIMSVSKDIIYLSDPYDKGNSLDGYVYSRKS